MIERLEPRRFLSGADTNGDFLVTFEDYFAVEHHMSAGDVNRDGRWNIDDYGIIDGERDHRIPDSQNTGARDPSPATHRLLTGKITLNRTGVFERFILTDGWIQVDAPGVTIRDFVIENSTGPGNAITFASDASGGLVEYGTIWGGTSGNAVKISNGTLRRLHVHSMPADAFRIRHNVTIESSYVHDIGQHPDAHGDVVQMYPVDGGGHVIRGNRFDARGGNAALFQVDNGWLVEGNWLGGGNYTVYASGHVGNVFRDNVFLPTAQYGPVRIGAGDESLIVWENNVWADTGEEILL